MKTILGEYGKLIILTIVLCGIMLVLFGREEDSLLGMLKTVRPIATLGHEDSYVLAESILSREAPKLSVITKKLYKGKEYNLLDSKTFHIEAENQDGEDVQVSVVKITGPVQQDITSKVMPEKFVPMLCGEYRVTYRASDTCQGSTKTTEKEYRFIAD
ncbi:MAG: hypothetical protein QM793_15140 [Muricomes sp.]